jgi:ribosome-associated translation inhibitor RaiA
MQVQVVTDNHVNGSAGLIENVETDLTDALHRFGNQITRVEVHLGDVNGAKKSGDDKHCLLEARLAGRQPVVVSHDAATVRQALDGAIGKLERSLDKQLGKLSDRKGRVPQGGELD